MSIYYVDTGYLLALMLRNDKHHAAAKSDFRSLPREGATLITSDAVLAETVTRLRYDAGLRAVTAFRDTTQRLVAAGTLRVRESSPELRDAALDYIERYHSRPLSYADAVGAAIAHEATVDAVLGFDHDFRMLGLALRPD